MLWSREDIRQKTYGFSIVSIDECVKLTLSTLMECSRLLNNRDKNPTPEAARHHTQLKGIAQHIPSLDSKANIFLLERDILSSQSSPAAKWTG